MIFASGEDFTVSILLKVSISAHVDRCSDVSLFVAKDSRQTVFFCLVFALRYLTRVVHVFHMFLMNFQKSGIWRLVEKVYNICCAGGNKQGNRGC